MTTMAPHVGSMSNMPGKHTHTHIHSPTHRHRHTRTCIHTCIKVINMPSNVTCTNYNNNNSNVLKHVTKLCVHGVISVCACVCVLCQGQFASNFRFSSVCYCSLPLPLHIWHTHIRTHTNTICKRTRLKTSRS